MRPILPWRNGSELISLWDIMKTLDFAKAFQLACGCQSTAAFLDPKQVTFVEGPDEALHPSLRTSLTTHYTQVSELCKNLELPASLAFCTQILTLLGSEHTAKGTWLNTPTRAFVTSIQSELASRLFLYVPYQNAGLYQEPFAGWEQIHDAFPNAVYDVEEASKGLALERSTACVFHCMRALEHGLRVLAGVFSIPFEHKSWGEIIEPIEKAIRDISKKKNKPANWKDDEQFYSGAASQFMHFKNAWRNYTAHVGFKYTETEAEAIYRHVREFMAHLAKRLKEPAATT